MRPTLKTLFIILVTVFQFTNLFAQDRIEEDGYFKNPVFTQYGIIFTDNYSSAIYLSKDNKLEEMVSYPGCGYYYSVSWDKNRVGFKLIDENGNQIPALFDLLSKEVIKLHGPVKQAGQVSFIKDGRYAFTIGEQLIVSDGNTYQLGYYSNIAPISPDGNYAVYNDNNDQIWLLNLNTKEKVMISDSELGYFYPKWAGNSQKLLYSGFTGIIKIYDIKTKTTFVLDEGHNPSWSDDSEFVIYYKKEIEGHQLINSDLYVSKFDGSITTRLTNSADIFEMDPQFSENDQRIIFHSYNKREIISARISSIKNSLSERKVLYKCSEDFKIKYYKVKPILEKITIEDVPYLHQVYDIPNWFWGYYACAPTTAAMVLAYYNILPKWETTCSSPYSHKSYWGRYVCEKYHYKEYYYNLGSSPAGHATGYGGYGYMWSTGSPNSRMRGYYEKHGMTASQSWSGSCTWQKAIDEINTGYPYTMCVWLTSSGHLVLGKGIVEGQHTLIFNDPYGNKNTPGYPSYDGNGALYDWPGYNHGNVNLATAGSGVPWCIATQNSVLAEVDTLVDDFDLEKGFYLHTQSPASMTYWFDKNEGHNGHCWWTYTTSSDMIDTCYATWTPNLPNEGNYEVYVYIPFIENATSYAKYKISHSEGESEIVINQNDNADSWVTLGIYIFEEGNNSRVKLGDADGIGGNKILFDAVEWSDRGDLGLDFYADDTSGRAPLTVRFTEQAQYTPSTCSWFWNFGDGYTSTERNPVHVYHNEGIYTVSLTISYEITNYTVTKIDYINVSEPLAGDFDLVYPENGSVISTLTPLFYWISSSKNESDSDLDDIISQIKNNEISGIVENTILSGELSNKNISSYRIYINTNSDFSEINPIEVDTNFYKLVIPLTENTECFWKVVAIDSFNDTTTSAVWSFYVNSENSAPDSFTLIAPVDGDVIANLLPTFEWNQSYDIDINDEITYSLKIGKSFENLVTIYTGSNTSFTAENPLLDNYVYYWKVDAIDLSGAATSNSEGYANFITNRENDPPSAVTLITPTNNSIETDLYPDFFWTEAIDPDPNDIISYVLQYWINPAVVHEVELDTNIYGNKKFRDNYQYFWTVKSVDKAGAYAFSDTFTFLVSTVRIDDVVNIPSEFNLHQNYPNPFNITTTLRYDLPQETHVHLIVYDILGRKVSTLVNGVENPGYKYAIWDATDNSGKPVSAGVYIYRIDAGSFVCSRKMILLK